MFVKNLAVAALAAMLSGGSIIARQTPPAATTTQTTTTAAPTAVPDGGMPTYWKPETAEQRRARIGTPDDPGINPDPNKHYWRFGQSYHIDKFERKWAVYDQVDPTFIRPFAPLNVSKELYQQNENWVWVWMPDPLTAEQQAAFDASTANNMTAEQVTYFSDLRPEFAALDVPDSGKTVRFEESSSGLPTGGSYRNSLAIADMNEDGCPDIITPPQRGGNGIPEIYLGDCKGHWKGWAETTWPYRMDYGSVVAADFNKDGHMDLAFGVHLNRVNVLLGDGKGHFTDSGNGARDRFPTRRILAADVDGDGYPDIIALSEGPAAAARGGEQTSEPAGRLRVYLNRNRAKSWEVVNVSPEGDDFGGDWLSIGKFNNDRYPDFLAASVYFNGPDIIWTSTAKNQWKNVGRGTFIPWVSYYFANATGHFSSRKLDDAIISYVRTWPTNIDGRVIPAPEGTTAVGIDRVTFTGKTPQRIPIVRWLAGSAIWGMAAADIDGDGNLDIIYTRTNPRSIELLLGDGHGNFRRANIEGITLPPNTTYDIKVADVNGDGKPDIILAFESAEISAFATKNGSIHVYLNRGTTAAPKRAEK